MRILFALLLLANPLLYADGEEASQEESYLITPVVNEPIRPEHIQVLLEKEVNEILLEAKGPYYIFNPKDGSRITTGLLGKRFIVHATKNGLRWGEEYPGIYQIHVRPRVPNASILINGVQYEGGVMIYAVDNKINVVNELPIETYVKAILTTQCPLPLENEVMSSLAILARTDAYYEVRKSRDAFWHVDAKEIGYVGSALNRPNSAIERIVDQTRHLILVHSEDGANSPFPARWTEHSAGKTAAFNSIFRKDVSFSNDHVDAPHAALDRNDSKWHYTISKEALGQKLNIKGITSLEQFIDKDSNKTYGVRIHHISGTKDFTFFELQNALSSDQLQSNDFKSELKGNTFHFTGFGKGHGVGLCIYSASAMAQNGDNALKILSKFFPETYLYNLSAQINRSEITQN